MNEQPHPEPDQQPNGSSGSVRGKLLAIGLYLAVSVGLYFILAPTFSDQQQLQEQFQQNGILGVLGFVVLYSFQVFIPWLPGAPLDVIAGATFGFWETLGITTTIATSCGFLVMWSVRHIGLEAIVQRFPALLESPWRLVRVIRKQPWSILAVNLLTGDVAYFVAGAARTPVVFTLVAFAIMRLPSVTMGAAIGAGLISNALNEQLNTLTAAASLITIAGLIIGLTIANRFLPGWLEQLENAADERAEAHKRKTQERTPPRSE